ncbi:hypothetical protein GGS24DRAFT_490519 [Hypoxylon argillaceum]|nr:hypothetical protein GGS24DRAFT_490519 [Hypoxylon argillaceum]
MLAAREGKKGFRARAQATLRGLTIDTKIAQESYWADNPSIAIRGSPNGRSSLLSRRENKKNSPSKADSMGLAADTQRAGNTGFTAENRLARKASHADIPRLSEAMMNRNWRNPRRPIEGSSSDMMESLWSAPPEQSKFPDDIKTKPRREDEHEVVDYDRGLKRIAYRCRRPEDVKPELVPYTRADSVSADLCLSAPATKTEFSAAEIGTEERSSKYDPSVFQPSVKTVVLLNDMAPTQRAGYEMILNWDEHHADLMRGKRGGLQDSSSVTRVSIVDSPRSWDVVEFPYAEIRPVKGDKKFETGLSNVEETIRNQLSALVVPQSAGLPPAYLRREYEERQKERRETMALARLTIEERGRRFASASGQESSGTTVSESPQFTDLLGKLNKLCAPRIRAFTVSDKDDANDAGREHQTQDAANNDCLRSLSGDSGISGLSSRGRKRSSTLNPQAVEFCCPKQEKQQLPVTNDPTPVPTQDPTPDPTTPDQTPDQTPDPIRRLETRVAELEAQLARQGPKKVQFTQPKWPKGNKMNKTPYGPGGYGSMAPGGSPHHPAMNNGIQGPGVYQSAPTAPPHQTSPGFPMGAGGMHPNPIPGVGQTAPGFPPNGMPNGFVNQFNSTPPMAPPFPGYGAGGPPKPALGTPLWVKSMFGPKPVSKPDRPFRPGDCLQATRQQEYEEYLEHLRITDPSYAQRCKQRQARRADRQRSGAQKAM